MTMDTRTPNEVLRDHLELAQKGDIDSDIARNFAEDCVLMTTYGNFRGHAGVREAAQLLAHQMGEGHYKYLRQECHQELAFLEWTADTARASIADGADSYWIRNGKIRAMTIHYSVRTK
jgi:hypothetical protein